MTTELTTGTQAGPGTGPDTMTPDATGRLTPFQAILWLYHQTLVPTACPCGRINLIGGLILWELARRGQLRMVGFGVPRIALYGRTTSQLRQSLEFFSRIMGLPAREGRVAISRKRGGCCDDDEILTMETPATPPRNLQDDRHMFILFYGENDPRLWYRHKAQARAVLPIRVSDWARTVGEIIEPNPVKLLCDEWLRLGTPRHHAGNWTWPCETTEWRSVVDDVLLTFKWPFLPRTVTTADDL